jgi:hypothetical protein
VVERFADEFAHGKARRLQWGIKAKLFGRHRREGTRKGES